MKSELLELLLCSAVVYNAVQKSALWSCGEHNMRNDQVLLVYDDFDDLE